jgi:hypothetical protein
MKAESLTVAAVFPLIEVHWYFFLIILYIYAWVLYFQSVSTQAIWSFDGSFQYREKDFQGLMSFQEIYLKV